MIKIKYHGVLKQVNLCIPQFTTVNAMVYFHNIHGGNFARRHRTKRN